MANGGKLPSSFTQKNLAELYLRLKLSGTKPKSASCVEMLLFCLNKAGLHKEVLDYCADSQSRSELERYYLAESLF